MIPADGLGAAGKSMKQNKQTKKQKNEISIFFSNRGYLLLLCYLLSVLIDVSFFCGPICDCNVGNVSTVGLIKKYLI